MRRFIAGATAALITTAGIGIAMTSAGAARAANGPLIAPYVDMGLYPPANLVAIKFATGIPSATLAFIVASGGSACVPAWGGYADYNVGGSGDFSSTISDFRKAGGRAIVSFGGANGTELASACSTTSALTSAYRKVVDRFGVDRIDFDVEGAAVADSTSNQRRAAAVAQLQRDLAASGKSLEVSLTLPVMPDGLTADGVRTVKEFAAAGVDLASVNIMAMDYGSSYTQMGEHAISAAKATSKQLAGIPAYADWSTAQRNALVGVTPMIGKNDVTPEVFTISDVSKLTSYIEQNGIGMLAWWELTRDKPCTGGATALYQCTGTDEPQWAYSRAFVNGAKNGSVPALPSPSTTSSTPNSPSETSTASPSSSKPPAGPRPTATSPGRAVAKAKITSDWGAGYCADVTVTTKSAKPIRWSVSKPIAGNVTSNWNASFAGKRFIGAEGNSQVSRGKPASFGYCATR